MLVRNRKSSLAMAAGTRHVTSRAGVTSDVTEGGMATKVSGGAGGGVAIANDTAMVNMN